jgi:hypothetical protein
VRPPWYLAVAWLAVCANAEPRRGGPPLITLAAVPAADTIGSPGVVRVHRQGRLVLEATPRPSALLDGSRAYIELALPGRAMVTVELGGRGPGTYAVAAQVDSGAAVVRVLLPGAPVLGAAHGAVRVDRLDERGCSIVIRADGPPTRRALFTLLAEFECSRVAHVR